MTSRSAPRSPGRPDEAMSGLVGFFVNTLVLRTTVTAADSFTALVAGAREAALGAYAHQDVPFEHLVDDLRPERSLARHPLFQVMLAFQNTPRPRLDLPGATISQLPAATAATKFDLEFSWRETPGPGGPGGLDGAVIYRTDLFTADAAGPIAGRLVRVLEQVAADPGLRVHQVSLLSDAERAELAARNATAAPVPDDTVTGLFADRAAAGAGCGGGCGWGCGAVLPVPGWLGGPAGVAAGTGGCGAGVGGGGAGAAVGGDGHGSAGGVVGRGGVPAAGPRVPARADRLHADRRSGGGAGVHAAGCGCLAGRARWPAAGDAG